MRKIFVFIAILFAVSFVVAAGYLYLGKDGAAPPQRTETKGGHIDSTVPAIGNVATANDSKQSTDQQQQIETKSNQAHEVQGNQSNSIPSTWFGYLVIVLVILTFSLAIIITVLSNVFKSRKISSNGMMAVLPITVSKDMQLLAGTFETLAKWFQGQLIEISKLLSSNAQAIEILKRELVSKDNEIANYRGNSLTREKEALISKSIKLATMLKTLEIQVQQNHVKPEVAIGFLKEELSDIFIEIGVAELNPSLGSKLADIPSDSYSVKNIIKTADPMKSMTIAEVIDVGYSLISADGRHKVIRAALINIFKAEN